MSIADREHFRVHLGTDSPFLFISDPIKGRISQKWTIQFTRGLFDDGEFVGVLVMAVSAEHLTASLKAIFPDPTDAASLIKNDGTYLARSYYLTDVLGQVLPASRPFIQHPELNDGTYETPGIVDEVLRFYSWRRVENYPLVMLVGLGADKAMALMRESIRDSYWQSATGSALLLLAGLTLSWLWTQRSVRATELQRAAEALTVETSRLNTMLKSFPGGVLIKDTEGRVVFVNARWGELLGFQNPASSLLGLQDSELKGLLGTEAASFLLQHEPSSSPGPKRAREVTTAAGRFLEAEYMDILQDGQDLGSLWLLRDITDRKQHELELTELASTDVLTGLANRRSFMHGMNSLYAAALRSETDGGVVMMLDIDRFKRVNDSYGHAVGDIVLQQIAQSIRSCVRATDLSGRFGGEEFVVLQPNTRIDEGLATAQRIRCRVEETPILADGHEIRVTISIGVSLLDARHSPEVALQQADQALYAAKNSGRNRVCLWEGLQAEVPCLPA